MALATGCSGGSSPVQPIVTHAPTPTPTPGPGVVSVNPGTLNFITTESSATQQTTVSESGYGGSFTASTTTCTGIATISPATSSGSFTVTPQGNGTCTFTITGSAGTSGTLAVTVTLSSATIQARVRGNAR
jgi:hypothetical protein